MRYREIRGTEDITDEILEVVRSIESGWYADTRIDWEDVWDRMEGTTLNDGTVVDMGPATDSPAMRKIKRTINQERTREG